MLITIDDFAQLNKKSVKGLYQVILRPGGNTGDVSNPGITVSEIAEEKPQGNIYYIKKFKRIERTCTHVDVDLAKVRAIYH